MRTVVDVAFAEDRVVGILRDISARQREQMRQEDEFAAGKNYEAASACRARCAGLMMAEAVIRDELKALERFKIAVIEAET